MKKKDESCELVIYFTHIKIIGSFVKSRFSEGAKRNNLSMKRNIKLKVRMAEKCWLFEERRENVK